MGPRGGKASGAAHVGGIARRRDRRLLEVGLLQIRLVELDLRAQPGGGVEREAVAEEWGGEPERTRASSPFVESDAFSKSALVMSASEK